MSGDQVLEDPLNEARLLQQLNDPGHPHVISLLQTFEDSVDCWMVLLPLHIQTIFVPTYSFYRIIYLCIQSRFSNWWLYGSLCLTYNRKNIFSLFRWWNLLNAESSLTSFVRPDVSMNLSLDCRFRNSFLTYFHEFKNFLARLKSFVFSTPIFDSWHKGFNRYFRHLIDALFYIHSRHICHLDLSLENLLMDASGSLKVLLSIS